MQSGWYWAGASTTAALTAYYTAPGFASLAARGPAVSWGLVGLGVGLAGYQAYQMGSNWDQMSTTQKVGSLAVIAGGFVGGWAGYARTAPRVATPVTAGEYVPNPLMTAIGEGYGLAAEAAFANPSRPLAGGASALIPKFARYGGYGQRQALFNRIRETGSISEAKGVVHAFREMQRLGYSLEDVSLHYSGNKGLDLVFSRAGRYAIVEAKHGSYLSSLKTWGGLRQGSGPYNVSRLQRYLRYGDGTHNVMVNTLRAEAAAGRLESFATFYRSGRIYELPTGWPRTAPPILR